MNNDLISRSALDGMKLFVAPGEKPDKETIGWNRAINYVIDTAPPQHPRQVRHGRWIHCKGKSNLWYCSECGEKIIYNPTRKTYKPEKLPVYAVNKWCRNCSAKMDGDEHAAD